jgi:hypothetical protein
MPSMTDVVPHADTSPGDGRRRSGGPRGHRAHRGLRVPGSAPTPTGGLPVAPSGDRDARARHRRAPGTSPIAVPTTGGSGSSRHRAAHPREAFDPATGPITASGPSSGPTPSAAPPTRAATTVRTGPGTGVTVALGTVGTAPEAGGTTPGAGGPSHAAPARRGVPLRATIGVLGTAGVATLFVMTSPGSPVPTSAPIDPLPAAAPAGLVGLDLPGAPAAAPAPLPVGPVAPPAVSTTPTTESAQPVIGALFDLTAGSLSDLFDNSGDEGLVESGARPAQ